MLRYGQAFTPVFKKTGLSAKTTRLGDRLSYPLTIENIRKLCDGITNTYERNKISFFLYRDSRPILEEPNEIKTEWILVGKDILPNSTNKTMQEQNSLLQKMEQYFKEIGFSEVSVGRRRATEAVWNEVVTLEGTGKTPLMRVVDRCKMIDPHNTPYAPSKTTTYLTVGGPLNSMDSPINVREIQPNFISPFMGVVPVLRIKGL